MIKAIEDVISTCVECHESYYHKKKKSDWIQCMQCSDWLHEDRTNFSEKCNNCRGKKGKNERLYCGT